MPLASSFTAARCARSPRDVFEILEDEFFFTDRISPNDDAYLHASCVWGAVVWLEVDTGHVEAWLRKAQQQAQMGKTVVALIPARCNTRAFHDYVLAHASEVRFVSGRLTYDSRQHQAPFASAVVIFRGDAADVSSVLSRTPQSRHTQALNVVSF
jgi:hypothetical protein